MFKRLLEWFFVNVVLCQPMAHTYPVQSLHARFSKAILHLVVGLHFLDRVYEFCLIVLSTAIEAAYKWDFIWEEVIQGSLEFIEVWSLRRIKWQHFGEKLVEMRRVEGFCFREKNQQLAVVESFLRDLVAEFGTLEKDTVQNSHR